MLLAKTYDTKCEGHKAAGKRMFYLYRMILLHFQTVPIAFFKALKNKSNFLSMLQQFPKVFVSLSVQICTREKRHFAPNFPGPRFREQLAELTSLAESDWY